MKQVCAWCGTQISLSEPHRESDISYGICLPCANAVVVDIPSDLRSFLNQISVPVVLVDCDGVVRSANQHACSMLGKSLADVEGKRGGEVFECAYSLLPGGCGNTYHCSGCVIRRSVMDTFQTGKPVYRMPATLKQSKTGQPQDIRFLVSTEKFNDCVILRVYGEDIV